MFSWNFQYSCFSEHLWTAASDIQSSYIARKKAPEFIGKLHAEDMQPSTLLKMSVIIHFLRIPLAKTMKLPNWLITFEATYFCRTLDFNTPICFKILFNMFINNCINRKIIKRKCGNCFGFIRQKNSPRTNDH